MVLFIFFIGIVLDQQPLEEHAFREVGFRKETSVLFKCRLPNSLKAP